MAWLTWETPFSPVCFLATKSNLGTVVISLSYTPRVVANHNRAIIPGILHSTRGTSTRERETERARALLDGMEWGWEHPTHSNGIHKRGTNRERFAILGMGSRTQRGLMYNVGNVAPWTTFPSTQRAMTAGEAWTWAKRYPPAPCSASLATAAFDSLCLACSSSCIEKEAAMLSSLHRKKTHPSKVLRIPNAN